MRTRFFALLLPLFAACSIESGSSDNSDGDRGGLGKADLVGSCEHKGKTFCGHKGKGNCWCDEACVDFGDCCSDADEVCGIEEPEPDGQECGGFLGLQCDDGEFCSFTPEQMCGAADQTGECLDRPEACIALFDPVCGCDGETYSNSCHAAAAGTSVAHEGECEAPEGQFCGGFGNLPCPDGQQCVDDPNDDCDPMNGGADCGGVCVTPQFCGGFANLQCPEGQECADNPDDGCDPMNGGADCGGICVPAAVDTCGPIEMDFAAETAAVRACETDDECGQVISGTSCGCTRNWVARIDADLSAFEEIRNKLEANSCELPGTISTCDCPAADGFACEQGICTWNYING
jgi:hypothetical protein